MKRLILILIFVFGTAASAQVCLVPNDSAVSKIILVPKNSNCELAQDMAKTLTDIALMFNKNTKVVMGFGGRDNSAGFDDGHVIRIPQQFINRDRYGKESDGHTVQLTGVVAHEYAHAMLADVIRPVFASAFQPVFEQIQRQSDLHEASLEAGLEYQEPVWPPALIPLVKNYVNHLLPYTELYADAVAVLYTNDAQIMFKSMYFDTVTYRMSDRDFNIIRMRDFSVPQDIKMLERFPDPHNHLSLVRAFIGQKMMTTSVVQKRRYLKILEDSIIKAMKINLANTAKGKEPLSIQASNDQLIKLLTEALQK